MTRQTRETDARVSAPGADVPANPPSALRVHGSSTGLGQRRHAPRTRADVEEGYVAARDAWAAAMRAANSGRAADLAALAIAQEAYEAAVSERERWANGARVAIPVEPENEQRKIGAIVGQELAWRQVRAPEAKPLGILGRIRRRVRGG